MNYEFIKFYLLFFCYGMISPLSSDLTAKYCYITPSTKLSNWIFKMSSVIDFVEKLYGLKLEKTCVTEGWREYWNFLEESKLVKKKKQL